MKDWEKEFDTLIGRPVSGKTIKNFIRQLLNENQKKDNKEIDSKK